MLTQVPFDILEQIVLQVALLDHGPPKHLIALLSTCRTIYGSVNFNAYPLLYANIFKCKFDVEAIARRYPKECTAIQNLADQLKVYCAVLKRIHGGDITAETVCNDMWCALLMMLENDGRNEEQLGWAGLKDFVDRYVRARLLEGSVHTAGWPTETPTNALVLWLMWFTTDEATLAEETADARRQLMELVRPYVVLPVRYPIYHVPDCHFELPVSGPVPHVATTPHGLYPPYRDPVPLQHTIVHFGVEFKVAAPLVATAARLLYFARSEATPFHIPDALHVNRDAAYEAGITTVIPTQEDYIRFNQHKAAAVVPKGKLATSTSWDEDWQRIRWCYDPWAVSPRKGSTYVYGSLEGAWMGRMLLPDASQYFAMVTGAQFQPHRPQMTTVPISFRLNEYHGVSPAAIIGHGGDPEDPNEDGLMNAWIPTGFELIESRGKLRVLSNTGATTTHYEKWQAKQPNSHKSDKCKLCANRRAKREELNEARLDRLRMKQRLTEKKRKSASDSDEEDDEMDVSEDEEGSDRENKARGKRPRTGRGPSAQRANPDVAGPPDLAQFDNSGMEQVDEDEVEAVRRQWQRVMGINTELDELIDAEMYTDDDNECNGVQDVIVIGETLPKHGQAWHHYKFYGRVRSWDGLIAMVRVPLNFPELGTTIFRGYIVGNQNLVGNWRTLNINVQAIPLEGPFIASRAKNAE